MIAPSIRATGFWSVLALTGTLALPALSQIAEPAELPPPDYAGQQYVDSNGCMFLRAGEGRNVVWIPRVTRQGVPQCGNPPSGKRVPVVEEGAPIVQPEAVAEALEPAVTPAQPSAGGYLVAVGSFGVAANADNAEARLLSLNYPVLRRNAVGALVTVFAGPFASAEDAARVRADLRGRGFPDAIVIGP